MQKEKEQTGKKYSSDRQEKKQYIQKEGKVINANNEKIMGMEVFVNTTVIYIVLKGHSFTKTEEEIKIVRMGEGGARMAA